jgi:hypothetical protein
MGNEQYCSDRLAWTCHRGSAEDAKEQQFFACPRSRSVGFPHGLIKAVRWHGSRGLHTAKNVPVLRVDYFEIQGTLFGVWEVVVKSSTGQLRLGTRGDEYALDNFCCDPDFVAPGF